jgi:osmoprotectant transport system permease protein
MDASEAGVIDPHLFLGFLGSFGGAIDFILHQQHSTVTGAQEVGGPAQVWELTRAQLEVSAIALALSIAVALPIGAFFGHHGRGEFLVVSFGNAGRALPEIALVFLLAAVIGVGLGNVAIALTVLGVPPILTNTFVGIRQVDRDAVEAARGMGMTGLGVLLRVEIPLAVPTIMSGIRTSAINIIATATIAAYVGYSDLGDFITAPNVYGSEGVLAGAICVAVLALLVEFTLAGVQRLLTPKGLKLQREGVRA